VHQVGSIYNIIQGCTVNKTWSSVRYNSENIISLSPSQWQPCILFISSVPLHLFIVPCYDNSSTPSSLPLLHFFEFRHPLSLISSSLSHFHILPSFLPFSFPILVYSSVASSFFSPFSSNDRWAFGGFPALLILFVGNGILIVAYCHFLRECKFDTSLSLSNILVLRQKDFLSFILVTRQDTEYKERPNWFGYLSQRPWWKQKEIK
jgi:hypothetical protein